MSLISYESSDEHWYDVERRRRREGDDGWLNRVRPPVFDVPGDLNPVAAAWLEQLLADRRAAGNLILTGDVGRGKTWTIWRIVAACVDAGYARKIEVVPAYDFKRVVVPPPDYHKLDHLARIQVLCLDDIGSVRLSEWDLDHLYSVIDRRSAGSQPTVISSNVLNLRNLLDERIASRLAANATIVELTGMDRRRSA
jgi:DNA replication protein DnaC